MNLPNDTGNTFRCGFITIIGAPNVGKSTLLNAMIGQKISITSQKPQTTRNRISGIVHRPDAQLVFVDTPGIHKSDGKLNERIVVQAISTLNDVDIILWVLDVSRPDNASESIIRTALKKQKQPIVLALNKIDRIRKPDLLRWMDHWKNLHPFCAIVPVSAKTGLQIPDLLNELEALLPIGPPLFPPDSVTDVSMRFLAAEIIREKVFRLTGDEIPYAVAVTIESFEEIPEKPLTRIHATVHVERDSQKGILIGKGGDKLRRIGESARKEIAEMTGSPVFLKLFVRVQKNWSRDNLSLNRFGYQ